MDRHRTTDDVADGVPRVHRHVRVLIDELDAAAGFGRSIGQPRGQRRAVEAQASGMRRQQAADDPGQRGLAAARLADHGEVPAAAHRQAYVMEHPEAAVRRPDRANLEDRIGLPGRGPGRRAAHPEQGPGVGVSGIAQQIARRLLLDLRAVAQHLDAVRDLGDHREVVRDVQRGDAGLAHRLADDGQHLDLGGDVEGRRGLVEDHEIGPARKRHGGHGALQLPAGDLVRVTVSECARIRQRHALEQLHRTFARPAEVGAAVDARHLQDLREDPVRRVECRGRALGDIGHPAPAHVVRDGGTGGAQFDAVEPNLSLRKAAPAAGVPHRGETQRGLAGARLPDQPQHLPAVEGQVDAVDDRPPFDSASRQAHARVNAQAVDQEQWRGHRCSPGTRSGGSGCDGRRRARRGAWRRTWRRIWREARCGAEAASAGISGGRGSRCA